MRDSQFQLDLSLRITNKNATGIREVVERNKERQYSLLKSLCGLATLYFNTYITP